MLFSVKQGCCFFSFQPSSTVIRPNGNRVTKEVVRTVIPRSLYYPELDTLHNTFQETAKLYNEYRHRYTCLHLVLRHLQRKLAPQGRGLNIAINNLRNLCGQAKVMARRQNSCLFIDYGAADVKFNCLDARTAEFALNMLKLLININQRISSLLINGPRIVKAVQVIVDKEVDHECLILQVEDLRYERDVVLDAFRQNMVQVKAVSDSVSVMQTHTLNILDDLTEAFRTVKWLKIDPPADQLLSDLFIYNDPLATDKLSGS